MKRLLKYLTPLDSEEQAFLVRQAVAAAVLARVERKEHSEAPSDSSIEETLCSLPEAIRSATTPRELWKAVQTAGNGKYSDEELEL